MGILRFILALTVIIAHSEPLYGFVFIEKVMAVQSFYIISGFYMAFILNEKYVGPGSYRIFITNRTLRLYPAYWFILCMTIIAFFTLRLAGFPYPIRFYIKYFHLLEIKSLIYILFTNIFIIGQDALSFLKLVPSDGGLVIRPNFLNASPAPGIYLLSLVPQAWTMSLELLFYAIAPFLVRKETYKLSVIIFLSLLLRFYMFDKGFDHDPWTYRFFPTELAFFLSGAVSYRIYIKLKDIKPGERLLSSVFLATVALTALYQFIPPVKEGWLNLNQWSYYLVLVVSIPFIFMHSRNKRFDNFLGELSYPMYISHILVFYVTTYYFSTSAQARYHTVKYLGSILLTILFSFLMLRFLIKPIEKYRQNRINAAP